MAFKFIAFAAFIAVARAGIIGHAEGPAALVSPGYATYAPASVSYAAPAIAAPLGHAAPVANAVIAEHHAPAHYEFGYSVSDPLTGDYKSQVERRHGDDVQGSYSLLESDGTKRTVDYVADHINGFNAVVRKEPAAAAAPAIAKISAPAVATYAAPAVAAYSAPAVAAYSAPAVHTYSAPAVYAHSSPAIHAYSAPAVHAYSAPAVHGFSSPALAAYAAPAVHSYGYAAPSLAYSSPLVANTYAAGPAVSYASPVFAKYH